MSLAYCTLRWKCRPLVAGWVTTGSALHGTTGTAADLLGFVVKHLCLSHAHVRTCTNTLHNIPFPSLPPCFSQSPQTSNEQTSEESQTLPISPLLAAHLYLLSTPSFFFSVNCLLHTHIPILDSMKTDQTADTKQHLTRSKQTEGPGRSRKRRPTSGRLFF